MLICVLFFGAPWTSACQASLSFTIFQSLLKLMFVELMMPSNHLILCSPLLLLPSIFPCIRVLSNELALCIRWLKYGASALVSAFPVNIQSRLPLGLTDLIFLLSKGLSRDFSTQFESINSLALSFPYCPNLTSVHDYWRNHSFD